MFLRHHLILFVDLRCLSVSDRHLDLMLVNYLINAMIETHSEFHVFRRDFL